MPAELVTFSVFALAAILGRMLTPICIRLSVRWNFVDRPLGIKTHSTSMPCLGGLALFGAFWTALGLGTGLAWIEGAVIPDKLGTIFIGTLIVFLLGALDDRVNLPPFVKLTGQAAAALVLIQSGFVINFLEPFGFAAQGATFLWLLLLMNAFNFIDSVDGHCAGVALVSASVFFWVVQIVGQPFIGLIVVALAGALLGFLPFNFRPARIFLGDNGSLFLGYLLGVITLLCSYQTPSADSITLLIPVLVFAVPIYDTLSVIAVRIFNRVPPWRGDRNHFAHRLVRIGMSEKIAVCFSYFIAATLGLLAILSTQIATLLGYLIILIIFISTLSIIAFFEYYATLRWRILQQLQSQHRRRKEDIQEEEDKRF